MRQDPDVRVGQIWQDCDKRLRGERTLEVLQRLPNGAVCRVFFRGEPMRNKPTTVILLRRFRPNSTGYRLIQDVPAVALKGENRG